MITVQYRLIGNVDNALLTKEFKTNTEFRAWQKDQINILILSVEYSGVATMEKLYG